MLNLTIDGKEVSVSDGTNLVDAAASVGIEIPTYCYHPGLTVVGQCRICFVEVEGMPRLVTACSTPAQDDMVVFTDSERVKEARAAVMEFLLENHPLDCPVCDQAGECLLQDYSVEHGKDTTHMVDERRTFPGFERRMIGPHVVQNQNRCIHCTRCIRFTEEISETADLTMKSRGNHSYIDTYDGKPLDNPWSACVADVCPVGALTVKEFRFRARVWHLDETPSICPGCSIGCNMTVGHLKREVHRFLPRHNHAVNGWWMCNYGRFLSDGINDREVERPLLRTADGDRVLSWQDAHAVVAERIGDGQQTRVIASANFSNEALLLVKKIFVDHLGLEVVVPVDSGEPRSIKNGDGEWVHGVDAHVNSSGAELLGLKTVDATGLGRFLALAEGSVLVLDGHAHPWLDSDEAASAVAGKPLLVAVRIQTQLTGSAELVLPLASWVETEGTYVSSTGRVQLARRALPPAAQALPPWQILQGLAAALDLEVGATVEALFREFCRSVGAIDEISLAELGRRSGAALKREVTDVG
jgi:NADH-quinone oxidoreductase subunit G